MAIDPTQWGAFMGTVKELACANLSEEKIKPSKEVFNNNTHTKKGGEWGDKETARIIASGQRKFYLQFQIATHPSFGTFKKKIYKCILKNIFFLSVSLGGKRRGGKMGAFVCILQGEDKCWSV